ncbi:hypothetical protein DL96DRAFT_1553436 [Flagelloscypha sp. PMI_526]|nr:hypothetical protein DL96DRAFT_1553436 [Flagelloscypha sp. PMI_526]
MNVEDTVLALNVTKSFPPIPEDISREIFEYMASSGGVPCITVSLVSKAVQNWTDRFVFSRILIKSHEKWELLANLTSNTTSRTVRMQCACSLLRILAFDYVMIGSELGTFDLDATVEVFPGLESVYVNCEKACPINILHPNLRRIGGAFGVLWVTNLQVPLSLSSITHLDITFCHPGNWHRLKILGLSRLPMLTHLCCSLGNLDMGTTLLDLLRVLVKIFPPSLLVCLVELPMISLYNIKETYEVGLDDRLVLCTQDEVHLEAEWILTAQLFDNVEEWGGLVPKENTFWKVRQRLCVVHLCIGFAKPRYECLHLCWFGHGITLPFTVEHNLKKPDLGMA